LEVPVEQDEEGPEDGLLVEDPLDEDEADDESEE
jgi:hypothetical protein